MSEPRWWTVPGEAIAHIYSLPDEPAVLRNFANMPLALCRWDPMGFVDAVPVTFTRAEAVLPRCHACARAATK